MNRFSIEEARRMIANCDQKGLDANLYAAVLCNEYNVAVVAIEAGADVRQFTRPSPLLSIAIKNRNFPIFELLMSHQNIDIYERDWKGISVIEHASKVPQFASYLEIYQSKFLKANS